MGSTIDEKRGAIGCGDDGWASKKNVLASTNNSGGVEDGKAEENAYGVKGGGWKGEKFNGGCWGGGDVGEKRGES